MHAGLNPIGRTIVPTLRYQDVAAAIDWLCNVFGFEEHLVVSGEDGAVRYAELTFGDGMVMVGPVEEDGADTPPMQAPRSGSETQTCYLFVADVRAHCTRAREAGAETSSTSTTRQAVGAATPAAISRVTSGISVPTILGSARLTRNGVGYDLPSAWAPRSGIPRW